MKVSIWFASIVESRVTEMNAVQLKQQKGLRRRIQFQKGCRNNQRRWLSWRFKNFTDPRCACNFNTTIKGPLMSARIFGRSTKVGIQEVVKGATIHQLSTWKEV